MLTIKTALLSLQSLLDAPEPSDPQDAEVARQMIASPAAFAAKAREWAREYAGAPANDGFSDVLVARFTGMGFAQGQVVAALRRAGVRRGSPNIPDEAAEAVIEFMCGGGH